MSRKRTVLFAGAIASVVLALPAYAVAPPPTDLNNCAITDINPNADLCDGYFSNLNTDGNPADAAFLESILNGWGISSSPEYKDGNTGAGTTTGLFDSYVTGGNNGSIELLAPLSGAFTVAIKAGNYLGLYFFNDTRSFLATQIFTFTIPEMGGDGLSHVSIFGGRMTVPEPATLALLGLGLAGLGLSRRRRK